MKRYQFSKLVETTNSCKVEIYLTVELDHELVDALEAIPGVCDVMKSKYMLTVWAGKLFTDTLLEDCEDVVTKLGYSLYDPAP